MNTQFKSTVLIITTLLGGLTLPVLANAYNTKDFDYTSPVQQANDTEAQWDNEALRDVLIEEQSDIYTISPGLSYTPDMGYTSNQSNTTNSRSSPVTIWVNHPNNTYTFGDTLVINATATQNGYLTIIDVGTSGTKRQLFPNKYQTNNYIRQGETIRIPAEHANFRYTIAGPAGTELLKAFITDSPNSILGKGENKLNSDVFPLISTDSKLLRKDILTELNDNQQGNWNTYNKVIYIIAPTSGVSHNTNLGQSAINAAQAERALGLNMAQIRDLQYRLRQKGYYNGNIDGVIGDQTRRAIANWQRATGLPATGYINIETFSGITG